MDKAYKIITSSVKLQFALLFITAILTVFCAATVYKPSYSMSQPRMRVNRTASLTLSTTWQKVDFSGTSTYNANTFPLDPAGSGNPLVYWDATNKIFKFYNTFDVNYITLFTSAGTATLLTTPVNVRMRITIPNGVSPGVDIHFSNPENDGYTDLGPASYIAHGNYAATIPIYISSVVRTNGFYIEAALSNGTLGTVTMDNAAFLIQSTNSIQ